MVEGWRLIQLITSKICAKDLNGTGFDAYTIKHQQQVARISNAIARKMGLSDDRILQVTLGALFHDIGKLFIPRRILNKKGNLSDAEYGLIRRHCLNGRILLESIGIAFRIYQIAFQHHERLDGSGYPQGLTGSQIPIESRIVAVADVLDAMTHNRPYRPALGGIDTVLNKIDSGRGTLYDPEVIDICFLLNSEKGWIFDEDRRKIAPQLSGKEYGFDHRNGNEPEGASLREVRGL
ncbi:MAG: HD domain-containing protein [Deltaproteobacteria bacterium]|nr:HD domain-containing protein [Deltaproteobacteria bacterium]